MRKIAAVAVTTAMLTAGLVGGAASADAAVAGKTKYKSWTSATKKKNLRDVSAHGVVARTKYHAWFVGKKSSLSDTARGNGFSAGLDLVFSEAGKRDDVWNLSIVKKGTKLLSDRGTTVRLGGVKSNNTGHLKIRECHYRLSTGKPSCGAWKKIY